MKSVIDQKEKVFVTAFKSVVVFFCVVAFFLVSTEVETETTTTTNGAILLRVEEHKEHHARRLYNLPDWGLDTWCTPQPLPGLPYTNCDPKEPVTIIPANQGDPLATFRTILLATIQTFQENRCLVVDDASMLLHDYFEPIGLLPQHTWVQNALHSQNVHVYTKYDFEMEQRSFNTSMSIPNLGYFDMESHFLRKILLRRIFRVLPERRHEMCSDLASLNLGKKYITLAVTPSGDSIRLHHYLDAVKEATQNQFDGFTPPIYVITDDCTVLKHFQQLEPSWRFVSECDRHPDRRIRGFWSGAHANEADASTVYHRFLVDLFAVAMSTYYIGIGDSEISWFAFFMRGTRHSFRLLDSFDGRDHIIFNQW